MSVVRRDVGVEQLQHELPAPRREHEPEERGGDGEAEQEARAERVPVGDRDAVAVRELREEDHEEQRAQTEPQRDLPPSS